MRGDFFKTLMPSLETEILLLPPSLTITFSRLLAFRILFLSDPSCVLYPIPIRFSFLLVAISLF